MLRRPIVSVAYLVRLVLVEVVVEEGELPPTLLTRQSTTSFPKVSKNHVEHASGIMFLLADAV